MSPREGEPDVGGDYEAYRSSHPWEDHGTPLSGEHSYPEQPTSAPGPRHVSADIQTQARSFPGQRPGQASTQVSMS